MRRLLRAHRLTGFSSMDTTHNPIKQWFVLGAPPDGFLIDGHNVTDGVIYFHGEAHRLTGFSSMDTYNRMLSEAPELLAHRLTGFSSMDTRSQAAL